MEKIEKSKDEAIKKAIMKDPHTTTRLSRANWRKWTRHLTYQKVAVTQDKCKDMMLLMGYNEVQQDTLLNSTSLLTKFCPSQNVTFC